MPSSRFLVLVLVIAQFVTQAVGGFAAHVRDGIVLPLLDLIMGAPPPNWKLGPFAIGEVISSAIECVVTIAVSVLVLRLVLKLCWRWIERVVPDLNERKD